MRRERMSWGARTNRTVDGMTARVDGQTVEVAQRAAQVIALAVRVLRIPTLVVLVAPVPFEVATLVLALATDGMTQVVMLALVAVMGAVSLAFGVRRARVLSAASDPAALATELGIAVSLSDKVDETRGALAQIAGGGGARVFSRLRGLWSGAGMTARWIDGVGDLPRARYFVPPRVGTTVTISIAALWLVPASVVVTVLVAIGALAAAL